MLNFNAIFQNIYFLVNGFSNLREFEFNDKTIFHILQMRHLHTINKRLRPTLSNQAFFIKDKNLID